MPILRALSAAHELEALLEDVLAADAGERGALLERLLHFLAIIRPEPHVLRGIVSPADRFLGARHGSA